jgi:hypothetical protein
MATDAKTRSDRAVTIASLVRSARAHGWIVAAACCLLSALANLPPVPNSDQALFAIAGRTIARGGRLYTDIWDTKLPSIDYAHALAWSLSGGNFYGITAFGLAIDALGVACFAVVARRLGYRWWRIAAVAYAAALAWCIEPNFTESYATAFVLAGFVAACYGRYLTCGLLVALAATFWVPSLALAVPPLVAAPDRRARTALAAGVGAGLAFAFVAFAALFGADRFRELADSWQAYRNEPFRFDAAHASPDPLDALRSTLLQTWLAAATVAAIAKLRAPNRFALTWFGCAIAGALAAPALYPHYFSAAVPAALLLGLPGGESSPQARVRKPLRLALACVAVLLALSSIDADRRHIVYRNRVAARAAELGRYYARELAPGERIDVDGYEPMLQLIVDRPLPDRFVLVATTQPYARAHLSPIPIDTKRSESLARGAREAGLDPSIRVLVVKADARER